MSARPHPTFADGRQLAIDMLREFESSDAEECSCESRYRDGEPQHDIFGRYLATLARSRNKELRAGFAFIMNDFLASIADGGVPDVDRLYQALEDTDSYGRSFEE